MAKAVAAMAALYVITAGTHRFEDEDGTTVEKGIGGKVSLTAEERKALPETVSVEPYEAYQERITASRAKPADLLAALPGGPVQSEISEANAVRLAESNEKLAAAIDRLATVLGPEPDAGDAGSPSDDPDASGDDTKAGDKSKAGKAS